MEFLNQSNETTQSEFNSEKMSKEIIIKSSRYVMEVPDLLLAYTYFLNSSHTCHLSIGYDTQNFNLKIILFKNNMFHTFGWSDWNILYGYTETIKKFLDHKHKADLIELPQTNGSTQFKMTIRGSKKCFMSVQNNKKIVLDVSECSKLLSHLQYINSIASWYNVTVNQIQNYYDHYLQICIDNNILQLLPHHFFLIGEEVNNFCNGSRIFNEIPVLCFNKLRTDLSQYYDNCVN